MAHAGKETGPLVIKGGASSDAAVCEVNHVGSVLRCRRDRVLRPDVGFYQSVGTALGVGEPAGSKKAAKRHTAAIRTVGPTLN